MSELRAPITDPPDRRLAYTHIAEGDATIPITFIGCGFIPLVDGVGPNRVDGVGANQRLHVTAYIGFEGIIRIMPTVQFQRSFDPIDELPLVKTASTPSTVDG